MCTFYRLLFLFSMQTFFFFFFAVQIISKQLLETPLTSSEHVFQKKMLVRSESRGGGNQDSADGQDLLQNLSPTVVFFAL